MLHERETTPRSAPKIPARLFVGGLARETDERVRDEIRAALASLADPAGMPDGASETK